jgi:hypothetical protein
MKDISMKIVLFFLFCISYGEILKLNLVINVKKGSIPQISIVIATACYCLIICKLKPILRYGMIYFMDFRD